MRSAKDSLQQAIQQVRGGQQVNEQNAEENRQARWKNILSI